jgi:hypothetical protein
VRATGFEPEFHMNHFVGESLVMNILSRFMAILGLAFGMAAFSAAATAGDAQVSKAAYSAERGSSLLQLVNNKPCCYSYRTGTYHRYSTKTCWRVDGRVVDDRYCRGGNWRNDHWRDDRWRDQRWQDPRWNGGGHGFQQLCCKRGRKEWWVQSVWECQNRRYGSIVHPSYCVRH